MRSLRKSSHDEFGFLLLARMALLNLIAVGIALGLGIGGAYSDLLSGEERLLQIAVAVIVLTHLYGLAKALVVGFAFSQELNYRRLRCGSVHYVSGTEKAIVLEGLRRKLLGRIAPVRNTASDLVLLGLLGTVLGFIVALGGVVSGSVAAEDTEGIRIMVAALIEGLRIALYTTLVGTTLNLWLKGNYRLLEAGASKILSIEEKAMVAANGSTTDV